MKFFKLVYYDLKQGLQYNKVKFIILSIVVVMFCVAFKFDTFKYTDIKQNTYGDYVLYVVEGSEQLPMEDIKQYLIPIMWIIIQILIGYIVGYYAVDDLNKYGQQILIRSGSRIRWWLSKCIWCLSMVLLAYFIIYSIIAIVCLIFQDKMNMDITELLLGKVFRSVSVEISSTELNLSLFIVPCLVSCCISMLQLTCSLIFSPVIGLIISQTIMFLSTLFENKYLIGNYAMFAKNSINGVTNIDIYEGLWICSGIFIVAFVVGLVYFDRCNILEKG